MSQPSLNAEEFAGFFRELWNRDPFPWQKEFARRICAGEPLEYVAVPTGSGKTACLDAAVFALAVQAGKKPAERTLGRRIFFVVNRRVIVDEAFERSCELRKKLTEAPTGSVLSRVDTALRSLTGEADGPPLVCTQLRGGIYRDRSWAGSLLQPMIICSTVDQTGSRLLFRGYGVSPQARPIHAALVGQDSLLIVDEAHISRPFIQTLDWVRQYRTYQPEGCETICLPFQLIQMTATPPAGVSDALKLSLSDEDREHPVLKPRLTGGKLARLVIEEKAKGKAREEQMARRLTKEAEDILDTHSPHSIAIMVNRVATARAVAAELKKDHGDRVTLLIGRLRPFDREAATRGIQEKLKTGAPSEGLEAGPHIVVSTQCLEVGADLDFDALVTEAASLDALRQRFGRLNRAGRGITARATVVLPGDQDIPLTKLDEKALCDPIYGNAIPRTWQWLQSHAQDGAIDFGINAMAPLVEALRAADPDVLSAMLSPTSDAPVLLPAYLDCWVQTNPAPAADPDVALFLHGPQRDMAEVQVCWRADLPEPPVSDRWTDILSLCPPTSVECLSVPLHIFRNWISSQGKFVDLSSDVGEAFEVSDKKKKEETRGISAFIWNGPEKSAFANKAEDLRPGDTVVLRAQDGGWQAIGYIPNAPADPTVKPDAELSLTDLQLLDVAEAGLASSRLRAVLRIRPELWPSAEKGTAANALLEISRGEDPDWTKAKVRDLLGSLLVNENPGWDLDDVQKPIVKHLSKLNASALTVDMYPDGRGMVIGTRVLMPRKVNAEDDLDGLDADSEELLEAAAPQELFAHTKDVLDRLKASLALLPLDVWHEALTAAANLHDWGKADPRFQALLRSTSRFAAMASGVFLAKSGTISSSAAARREASQRAELPKSFRHEMLSVQLAASASGETSLPPTPGLRDLTLHLIATHHGYGRPFAPISEDEESPAVSLLTPDKTVSITKAERLACPPHILDSGIAERFWQLTRHHGWWGIAYLESVLRLADQTASAHPKTLSNS